MTTNKEKEVLQLIIDGKLDIGTSVYLIREIKEYQHRFEANVCGIHTYDTSLCLDWVQYDHNYEEPDEVWDEGDEYFRDYGETWTLDFDYYKEKMKEKYNWDFNTLLD